MPDNLSKKERKYNMSRIRSSKTKPELKFKVLLSILGFNYQPRGIFGRPDFADRKNKIAIFIDGCFWHKCPVHYRSPKTNRDYWKVKIKKNTNRDEKVRRKLESEGWRIIRIWEHQLKR